MEIISVLFPGWALRRKQARLALERISGAYQAAKSTRTHPRRGSHGSGDSIMAQANWSLRAYARFLDENHDLAIGLFQDIVNRVIGTGLSIEQMSIDRQGQPAEEFNREVDLLWQDWSARPETTGETPLGEAERLVCRSLVRDGEHLIHHVTGGRYPYVGEVPYVIELLEADYLPFDLMSREPLIVQGVEKNGWGRPVAYHLYRDHPGDQGMNTQSTLLARSELKRMAASEITHVKHIKRVRQTRGVPIIHGCIQRLADIKDYEESERIAARANADIVGVITNEGAPLGSPSDAESAEPVQELEMANGFMWTVVNGQKVEITDAKRPNQGLQAFRDSQIKMVAAGAGTRYSPIARDFSGTYSSQRQELVEGAIDYDRIREYLISTWYQRMRRNFIDAAILVGVLRPPRSLDRRSLYWADYRGPANPQIDIEKEMKGREIAEDRGWTSRTQNTRAIGNDPRVVERQRALEGETGTLDDSADDDPAQNSDGVIAWRG